MYIYHHTRVRVKVMALNATLNNISVISWWSVLIGGRILLKVALNTKKSINQSIGGGNRSTMRKPPTYPSHWQTVSRHTSPWAWIELTTLVVIISTDCTCSCKSNYHTITTMTIPMPHAYTKTAIHSVGTEQYIIYHDQL